MENRECIQQSLDQIEAELASKSAQMSWQKRQAIRCSTIITYFRKKSECRSCSIL